MNPSEQAAFDFAQSSFAKNLPDIDVFSPEVIQGLNSQVEAFKLNGIKNINDIYTPMIRNLQNDIASRFGNLNNSVFMDKLYGLEGKRADAVSSLSQDVTARAQELINNEITNRYNYLNFLNNYQNQALNQANKVQGTNASLNTGAMPTVSASNNNSDLMLQLLKMAVQVAL
jgi:hypothetical protein